MAVEKGTMTQEQRDAISKRMKKFHRGKKKTARTKGNGIIKRTYARKQAKPQKFALVSAREEAEATLTIVDAIEDLRPAVRTNVLAFITRHFPQ